MNGKLQSRQLLWVGVRWGEASGPEAKALKITSLQNDVDV